VPITEEEEEDFA